MDDEKKTRDEIERISKEAYELAINVDWRLMPEFVAALEMAQCVLRARMAGSAVKISLEQLFEKLAPGASRVMREYRQKEH